jgi:hypothetical protein
MRTIIISVNDNGSVANMAETSVSFEKIEKFVKDTIDNEDAPEGNDGDEDNEPKLLKYIREKYPNFYKNATEDELLDEPMIKAIEFLAGKVGKTPEEFVDLMARAPQFGQSTVRQFAFSLTSVRSMFIELNGYKCKN